MEGLDRHQGDGVSQRTEDQKAFKEFCHKQVHMEKFGEKKVPGGKLLKVHLNIEATQEVHMITSTKITGDFFLHPEDVIDEIENHLKQIIIPITSEKQHGLEIMIDQVLVDEHAQLIGASAKDIVDLLVEVSEQ